MRKCWMLGWALLAASAAWGLDEVTSDDLTQVLDDRMLYFTQGWGEMGINTAVKPTDGRAPMPLQIKDTKYAKGIGTHAPSEIVIELNGDYTALAGEIGVQQQDHNAGSVVFQVYVDDQLKFDSDVMHESDEPRKLGVNIAGGRTLRLVVTDAGDGITCDCADWADARLVKVFPPKEHPASEMTDMAPFARVVASDPHREEGTKATRIEEFPAADVYLETNVASKEGLYPVPTAADGVGCIGLVWAERRLLKSLALEFPEGADMPDRQSARVQFWLGESPWQGAWKPLRGDIAAEGRRWTIPVSSKANPELPRTGVEKIRWVFPAGQCPAAVKQFFAFTRSQWDMASLRIEVASPTPGAMGSAEIYNGERIRRTDKHDGFAVEPRQWTWDTSAGCQFTVHYTKPKPWKSDRTILRLVLPQGACGVAVEDVVRDGCVYVPDRGLYVATATTSLSLAEYAQSIQNKKLVLDQVREMPDQSFAQALDKTHNPVQNLGPMMISLACDNHKFIAHREGAIQFAPFGAEAEDEKGRMRLAYQLTPRFGSGKNESVERHLEGGWLPAPVTTVREGDIAYRLCSFVAPTGLAPATAPQWLNDRPVCVGDFLIENTGEKPAAAALQLNLSGEDKPCPPAKAAEGAFFVHAGDLIALVDTRAAAPLTCELRDNAVHLTGSLPAHAKAHCYVYLPGWKAAAESFRVEANPERLFGNLKTYWEHALADAAQIETPDPLLTNVIRASQVHCLLAARNELGGKNVAAWIGSDRYGPLESEAHSVILGMDLMGQTEFARRALDFFIQRYNAHGYLTTGYTLMGTGWHLWTLARHFALTGDRAWFDTVAPKVAGVCQWIGQQCQKTKCDPVDLEQTPEYGLVPPGVGADWNRFAYRFAVEANYYAGLHDAASALASIEHPNANRLLEQAKTFRDDLLRAYRWNQGKAPALALPNGTYVPSYGGMLYSFGASGEMIPGEDGNRSWAYDVELGSHHLIPLGVLDPQGIDATEIVNHMEDVWFLHTGMCDYPEAKNLADWFDMGGFSKVQPYYTRNAEIYALRDDVKPFIRSYFNALAAMLSLENLSLWEHFHNTGAWNKTHETGWFLVQTRTMFVTERGDELWLAPFLPSSWLDDGKTVSVKNAPTAFGPVSYTITSSAAQGHIDAVVEPPTRSAPKRIALRVRHPQGFPVQSVAVNGLADVQFDAAKTCVYLEPQPEPITVHVAYGAKP